MFSDFRTSVLSDGKGAAFIPHPSTGTLGPFQQISIDVTAYYNMWGDYSDLLVCTVCELMINMWLVLYFIMYPALYLRFGTSNWIHS